MSADPTKPASGRHRRRPEVRRGARRALVGVLDQGLYSVANFGLTVLVAHESAPREFGAYSLGLAIYALLLGAVRGLTAEVFLVKYSGTDATGWRHAAACSSGLVAGASCACGVVLILFGLVSHGVLGSVLVAFGVFLPFLLLQDLWRYFYLSEGRPLSAFNNDALVTAVQVTAAMVLLKSHQANATTLVGSWGAASFVGFAVAACSTKIVPKVSAAPTWLRENRELALRFAADDLMGIGAIQATTFVLAPVAGLTAVAALRGAQTIFGPLMVLNAGVTSAITPELIRANERSANRMQRHVLSITGVLVSVSVLWTIVVLVLPSAVGSKAFGGTWLVARPLLVYFAVVQAAYAARVGPSAGLRALRAARATVWARAWASLVGLLIPVVGAAVSGTVGAALGFAVASPLQAAVWWSQFRRSSRGKGARNGIEATQSA